MLIRKIILVSFLLLLPASPVLALKANDLAPSFSLRDSNGGNFFFSDYIGPKKKHQVKGIILCFFASYCEPCKHELPILNSLVDEFEKMEVKIVIVGSNEDFDKIGAMLDDIKVDKPIILSDTYGKMGQKYGVTSLPITFFIGEDGRVKDVFRNGPNIEKTLREKVGKLLK